jgi:hypothetical protein
MTPEKSVYEEKKKKKKKLGVCQNQFTTVALITASPSILNALPTVRTEANKTS